MRLEIFLTFFEGFWGSFSDKTFSYKKTCSIVRETKSDTIEVLIYKPLIDSYINHEEFVSVNNFLREYNAMKEEIKNSETSMKYAI